MTILSTASRACYRPTGARNWWGFRFMSQRDKFINSKQLQSSEYFR